ncbi:hypothetical protein CAEBREN_11513 [Caenorhabditis brenneri]|uniref:Uncharacterized protein n=1 Tax=Caenorhabditis brenneri TaxID=135651 RepID=G0P1Q1_CAEBE|nr:hypothetical protein CAEBREN_11513 [Caenorhabditis brenneri]
MSSSVIPTVPHANSIITVTGTGAVVGVTDVSKAGFGIGVNPFEPSLPCNPWLTRKPTENKKLTPHDIIYNQSLYQLIEDFESISEKPLPKAYQQLKKDIEKLLKGEGVPVKTTERVFRMGVYSPGKEFDYKNQMVCSVLYSGEVADKMKKKELRGKQIVIVHQSTTKGALHILLSHPQNMQDLVPNLNLSLFPSFYQDVFKQKKLISDDEKKKLVAKAAEYYQSHPEEKLAMMENELKLVARLSAEIVQCGEKAIHQFYLPAHDRQRFKIHFDHQLCVGFSCDTRRPGSSILYTSPGRDGVERDCFEIISAWIKD